MIEQLDMKWTHYEQCYVFELMVIETDARRFIVEAIALEQRLQDFELAQRKQGVAIMGPQHEYNQIRE